MRSPKGDVGLECSVSNLSVSFQLMGNPKKGVPGSQSTSGLVSVDKRRLCQMQEYSQEHLALWESEGPTTSPEIALP